jgi:hypothetical protein
MTDCRLLTSSMSFKGSVYLSYSHVDCRWCECSRVGGSRCLDIPVGDYLLFLIFEVCLASQTHVECCEVPFIALWAVLWMSQCSGSAMLGEYIRMSQHLYFIVKYEYSGCPSALLVPYRPEISGCPSIVVIPCRYEWSGCPSAVMVPCRSEICYL